MVGATVAYRPPLPIRAVPVGQLAVLLRCAQRPSSQEDKVNDHKRHIRETARIRELGCPKKKVHTVLKPFNCATSESINGQWWLV